jgi:hypothetical protein
MSRLIPLFFLAAGCSSTPEINANVVDVWGTPVAGATIIQEGVVEHFKTDDKGKITIEAKPGQVRLLASRDGYTRDLQIIEITEETEAESRTFTLYPVPETPGFYGIGEKEYDPLEPYKVDTVASEMSVFHGVKDTPQSKLPRQKGKPHRFVFKTDLRAEEISRFDLRLSKLKFIPETSVVGVTGDTDIKLNLWVADSDVDYSVKSLTAEDVYLLTTDVPIDPRMYAFHAQNILNTTDSVSLERLPKELRVVYPFEIK